MIDDTVAALRALRARVETLEGDVKIIETSFTDVCDALGCPYDNEAALFAVDALRARVAELEADLEAARRSARLAQGAHDIVSARVETLEAALKRASHHFVTVGKLHSLDMRGPLHEIDAALKDAPR